MLIQHNVKWLYLLAWGTKTSSGKYCELHFIYKEWKIFKDRYKFSRVGI